VTRTPPTFVAEYESTWNASTTPRSVSATIAPNDCLIIAGITSNDTTPFSGLYPQDTLGTHLTYNLLESILVTDYCALKLWSVLNTGGQSGTFTLSLGTTSGVDDWGFNCLRFSGVQSIGNHAQNHAEVSSGGQVLNLTTSAENSVVVCFAGDWTADPATDRQWKNINGTQPTSANGFVKTFQVITAVYGVYGAYWPDVGAAGTHDYGVNPPIDQKYSIAAVELVGPSVGGGPALVSAGFFDGI